MIALQMQRCLHLYRSGWQCDSEAAPGSGFCENHFSEVEFERLRDRPFRKLTLKIVAVILVIMFLIPFYYTLKSLYASRPTQAQESW